MTPAAVTTHALGCLMPTPKLDTSGYFRCPQCHYDQPRPRASTQPSNYVCRIHNGEPVSWKGTGCTRCAADLFLDCPLDGEYGADATAAHGP